MGRNQTFIYDNSTIHEDLFMPEGDRGFGFSISDDVGESVFGVSSQFAHRHPFYEMIFIEKADGEHIIDHTIYENMKKVVFMISPGQVHRWRNVTQARGVLVYFTEDFLFQSCASINSVWEIQLFKEIALAPAIYMEETLAVSIQTILKAMLKEYKEKAADYPSVLRAYLNILLIQFYRCHEMAYREKDKSKLSANEIYLQLQNVIDQRKYENLTVSEYADILGMSQCSLNDQVKLCTGKSVGTLIRDAKFNEAKRLLINTELNVNEIAEKMGFLDTAYFCRAFKRYVGESPGQYRTKCVQSMKKYANR